MSDISLTKEFSNFVKLFDKKDKNILYLPLNNREMQQTGMEKAFVDNGFGLCSYDFYIHSSDYSKQDSNEFLINLVKWYNPFWIHMQLQDVNCIFPNTLLKIKQLFPNIYISNWTGDIRNKPIQYFVDISKEIDLSLISSTGQIEMYRSYGCKNVNFLLPGFDPVLFYRKSEEERKKLHEEYKHDIVFCGNNIKWEIFPGAEFRQNMISIFDKNFGEKFWSYGVGYEGSRGSLNFFKQNDVYNASKIVISMNHFNDVENCFSNRQIVSVASGTLALSKYVPGLENYFENKKDLVWFHNEQEALELANYYLEHEDEAIEIGKSGAKKVLEEHSYFCRAKELFNMVSKLMEINLLNE